MIRPIEVKDVIACHTIVLDNWDAVVAERFKHELDMAFNTTLKWPPEYFVYESYSLDGVLEIIGFAGIMPSFLKEGVWDLVWVNVARDCQRIGVGADLVEHIIELVRERKGIAIHLMTEKPEYFIQFGFDDSCSDEVFFGGYGGDWTLMRIVL